MLQGRKDAEPPPRELSEMFQRIAGLRKPFDGLTSGKRRAYILHFSGAKQSKTRIPCTEKCIPGILDGQGLNDRERRRTKRTYCTAERYVDRDKSSC